MPRDNESRQERFRAIQEKYARGLRERITETATLWQALLRDPADNAVRDALRRVVHGIAGSAGTFGYNAISVTVRKLEPLLYQALSDNQNLSVLQAEIEPLIEILKALVPTGPELVVHLPGLKVTEHTRSRLVYLVEDDLALAEELAWQLDVFNWEVQCFGSASQAIAALQRKIPAAIVVDIGMPEGELAGAKAIQQFLAEKPGIYLPSVFISSRYDWAARLEAARAGANIYLRKPFDGSDLAAALLRLTEPEEDPYRVLIVDDNALLAEHYAAVLANAGMKTFVLTDAAGLLNAVEQHNPELVLMDVYMPGCSGIEAAAVIRQDPDLIGLPIVYISTEVEKNNQMDAMRRGADDFLEKPIADQELVAAVSTRAARFRSIASVMNRDSMTKLHNHTAIKQRLESEYALAKRSGQPLVFAMIDIDHFKKVNDTYGHPVGDRVIRSLAQLLKQRLRKYDVIGRYGGEEFAVVMPHTTSAQAKDVFDTLREQFARIEFKTHNVFTCSFSAGIAQVSGTATMEEMIANADKALYVSKAKGRNTVTIHVT